MLTQRGRRAQRRRALRNFARPTGIVESVCPCLGLLHRRAAPRRARPSSRHVVPYFLGGRARPAPGTALACRHLAQPAAAVAGADVHAVRGRAAVIVPGLGPGAGRRVSPGLRRRVRPRVHAQPLGARAAGGGPGRHRRHSGAGAPRPWPSRPGAPARMADLDGRAVQRHGDGAGGALRLRARPGGRRPGAGRHPDLPEPGGAVRQRLRADGAAAARRDQRAVGAVGGGHARQARGRADLFQPQHHHLHRLGRPDAAASAGARPGQFRGGHRPAVSGHAGGTPGGPAPGAWCARRPSDPPPP